MLCEQTEFNLPITIFFLFFFFFNDTATTEIYTLSLHDALPISPSGYSSINSVSPARFAKFERSITDLLNVREWGEARDTLNPTGEVTLFDRIPDDRRGRWLSNVAQS